MSKYKKAYAFRHFQKLQEKELKEYQKTKPQKEVIAYGVRVKEQVITYKKRNFSIIVYRGSNGRFIKSPFKKIKEQPEKKKIIGDFFGKSEYYRASVFAEIPYHGDAEKNIHKYYWFGIIVIDKKENIDIEHMKQQLLALLERELHYKTFDFWFDVTYSIEYPKPYPATHKDYIEEKWSKTKK